MINVPTIFDFDQGNSKARCGLKRRPGVHPAQGAADCQQYRQTAGAIEALIQ
jgi:hypothetical protein